jgi:hypothetical protein
MVKCQKKGPKNDARKGNNKNETKSVLPENEFDCEPKDDQSFHVEESHVS